MLINYITRYHEADKGTTGSGATTETETQSDTSQTQTDEKRFSQADMDRVVADRLARQKSAYESQQQKAKSEAEAKRLEEEKQFKELADQRASEIVALKPLAERADTYEQLVKDLLTQQREGLPQFVLDALDEMTTEKQVAYLKKNRADILAKQSKSSDINAGNRNAGKPTAAEQLEQKKLELSKRGGYTRY